MSFWFNFHRFASPLLKYVATIIPFMHNDSLLMGKILCYYNQFSLKRLEVRNQGTASLKTSSQPWDNWSLILSSSMGDFRLEIEYDRLKFNVIIILWTIAIEFNHLVCIIMTSSRLPVRLKLWKWLLIIIDDPSVDSDFSGDYLRSWKYEIS